jgi:hypothetical protein
MNEAKHTSRLSELQQTLGCLGAVQVALILFTALLLDRGYCGQICICAVVGYWLMVGWLALRRRKALTKTDTILIRIGFVLCLPIALLVSFLLESLLNV